jgi:hypothetical protein
MPPHRPFEGSHGYHELESSLSMLPFLGSLLLLLLVLAALYLWHQGKLPLPKLGGHRSPEEEAKGPSPNASPVGTSAQMSSWNGPAS